MHFELPDKEIRKLVARFQPTATRMDVMGKFLHAQVRERFASKGVSGGKIWRDGWLDGKREVLGGVSGAMFKAFFWEAANGNTEVYCIDQHSRINQLGTVGKGGILPDIKAKKGKALFVPITDKAKQSTLATGAQAAMVRGSTSDERPLRAGIRYIKNKTMLATFVLLPLTPGRIKGGKLQVRDPITNEWRPGEPDFIFLKRVSIPSRPMLPDSKPEGDAQAAFLTDLLAGPARPSRRI